MESPGQNPPNIDAENMEQQLHLWNARPVTPERTMLPRVVATSSRTWSSTRTLPFPGTVRSSHGSRGQHGRSSSGWQRAATLTAPRKGLSGLSASGILCRIQTVHDEHGRPT